MTHKDPPRLLEGPLATGGRLGEALRAARADGPTPTEIAALAARLPLALPGSGGGTAGTPPASPTGGGAVTPVATAAPPSVLSGALIGAAVGVLVAAGG